MMNARSTLFSLRSAHELSILAGWYSVSVSRNLGPGRDVSSRRHRPPAAPGWKAWTKLQGKSTTYGAKPVKRIIGAPAQAANAQVKWLEVGEESAGQRLDNYLMRQLKGVPKTHVYRIIRSGEVRVNKGRAGAD